MKDLNEVLHLLLDIHHSEYVMHDPCKVNAQPPSATLLQPIILRLVVLMSLDNVPIVSAVSRLLPAALQPPIQ